MSHHKICRNIIAHLYIHHIHSACRLPDQYRSLLGADGARSADRSSEIAALHSSSLEGTCRLISAALGKGPHGRSCPNNRQHHENRSKSVEKTSHCYPPRAKKTRQFKILPYVYE